MADVSARNALAVVLVLAVALTAVPATETSAATARPGYCDVTYRVTKNQGALKAALRDITQVTGITFTRARRGTAADLRVVVKSTPRRGKPRTIADATLLRPRTIATTHWTPKIRVYSLLWRYDYRTRRSIYQHELGHILGLNHVKSPREVMYPKAHGKLNTRKWKSRLRMMYRRC